MPDPLNTHTPEKSRGSLRLAPVEVGVGCPAKKGVYCREIQYIITEVIPVLHRRTFLHAAPPMSPREHCNCSRSSSLPAARRLFPPASPMTHQTWSQSGTAAVCGFCWVSKVNKRSKVFERQWRRSSNLQQAACNRLFTSKRVCPFHRACRAVAR